MTGCSVSSFIVVSVLGILTNVQQSNAYTPKLSKDSDLIEAGCFFDWCGGMCEAPKLKGEGNLLQKGACVNDTYSKSTIPEIGVTKAYTTIISQKVRDVDSRKEELSIDITASILWIDPGIKSNFSVAGYQLGGMGMSLEPDDLKFIWKPDIYIYNNSDFKSFSDSTQVKTFRLSSFNDSSLYHIETRSKSDITVVQYTIEAKVKVYCNFNFKYYPMDRQFCRLRLGSRSSIIPFRLHDPLNEAHLKKEYQADNFDIGITFYDGGFDRGDNLIGFDINLVRILKQNFMAYYFPCIASVLVSQIGFLIPLTSIPGRAALLVTQFLSLINLFIAAMVESPTESEMTAVGIYILSSLIFAVATLLEFAFVITLHRIDQTRKPKIDPLPNDIPYFKKGSFSARRRFRRTNEQRKNYLPDQNYQNKKQDGIAVFSLQYINKIDFMAFWSFLFIYFLFNFFYWILYLWY